jgi:hypothetical protein
LRAIDRNIKRPLLGALALATVAAPSLASGCGGGFDGQSLVQGLRVLAVVADKPYAAPGESVEFTMTVVDAFSNTNPAVGGRDIQVLWFGGCIDPEGDYYYNCYESIQEQIEQFSSFRPGDPLPEGIEGVIGYGPTFKLAPLPEDIVSRRPVPRTGPHYGIAVVFFAACAGQIRPVPIEVDAGVAGSFPLGCFDENGNRLGADSFVPGYTQVYAFADDRPNTNPDLQGIKIRKTTDNDSEPYQIIGEDSETPDNLVAAFPVEICPMSYDDRKIVSCSQNAFTDCPSYDIDIDVGPNVSDEDPEGTTPEGKRLHEAVWVDYFADAGTFEQELKLVYDANTGLQTDRRTHWIAPPEKRFVTIWAVLHDARGGQSVLKRYLKVE